MTTLTGAATVRQLVPTQDQVTVPDLLARVRASPPPPAFAPALLDACAAFAGRLRRAARGVPEVQALAYWLRPSGLQRLAQEYAALGTDAVVLAPRGTVLHIPPANVDTMFVYTWLLSTMVGNRNVVRLSSRLGDQADRIVGALREVLDEDAFAVIRDATAMIQYDRDTTVTDDLSAACDLRVIWGGDATVAAVRTSPLPPHATDLTFPDRFSLAAVRVPSYLDLAGPSRDRLVERFVNDAYPFAQLACSSPRLVVWVGADDPAGTAAEDFFARLARLVRHRYRTEAATALAKLGYAHRAAIDWPVADIRSYTSALTVIHLRAFADVRDEFCGAGTFFSLQVPALTDLGPYLERRDQTLAQFGFDPATLRAFVRELNGRAVDRVVPIGEALTFHRIWDGHDLLQAFSRRTTIDLTEAHLT